MNVSDLFRTFGPSLIAHCTAIRNRDYWNKEKYEKMAADIINVPQTNIFFVLVKTENGMKLGGVENSEDIFKLMPLEQLANLEFGFPPGMTEASFLLDEYSFFKL